MIDGLRRFVAPLQRRISMLVARAIVDAADDAALLQLMQVKLLSGEVRGRVERFQNYGFTGVPHPGGKAEAVALSMAGNRDHLVVVALDDRRYRLKNLAPGEVGVYAHDGTQLSTLIFKTGGILEIRCVQLDLVASGGIGIQGAGAVAISGDQVTIAGGTRVDIDGPTVDLQNKGDYKLHVHTDTQPGTGVSGPVS